MDLSAADIPCSASRKVIPCGKEHHMREVLSCSIFLFLFSLVFSLMFSGILVADEPHQWDRAVFDPTKPFPSVLLPGIENLKAITPTLLSQDSLNVKVNSDTVSDIHNEEQIWVNPTNEDNLVAVWRDFRLHYRRVGVAYSFDGGETWTDTLFNKPKYEWQSDPGLTVDSEGNFYAVVLDYIDVTLPNGLYVFMSSDGGVTWGDPVTVVDSVVGVFEDKELIACDRTGGPGDGNLYVAWARFGGSGASIWNASSLDGGQSFEEPVRVSDHYLVQWPVPTVGPDGELIVAWVRYDPPSIYYDISYDGGSTFGTDMHLTDLTYASVQINGGILTFSFPVIDVDLTGGVFHGIVYVVYMDVVSGDADIFFRKSLDGGFTWSEPLRINDDEINNGADQFHPWMSIDEEGNLVVVFYDRRLDLPDNYMMDVFMTVSTDGGATFSPNQRVTTVSSDPLAGQGFTRAGLIGEYIGVSARNGTAHSVWTDTRTGHQEVWAAAMDYSYLGVGEPAAGPVLPRSVAMQQNYPNPFNPSTTIRFDLPGNEGEKRNVTIVVYDMRGRRVRMLIDSDLEPGNHQVHWNGRNDRGESVGSGIYLYTLNAGGERFTRKMTVLK